MRSLSWAVSLLFALLAAACQPEAATLPPKPTPALVEVQFTPALRPLQADLTACASQQPEIGLVVHELPLPAMTASGGALRLQIGTPASDAEAYLLGWEELALAAAPPGAPPALSVEGVNALYSGAVISWQDLTAAQCPSCAPASLPTAPVQVLAYPPGDDLRAAFEALFPAAQSLTRNALLTPDPAAMRQAFLDTPGSIGYLPRRWLDASVKIVEVRGLAAGSLLQPITALAPSPLPATHEQFLLCLQRRLGQ